MQVFWRGWSSEYLPQLQIRGKWISNKAPLNIGDIAIIKDENTPPTKWKLGRVVNVHPGKDGIIRVVTMRIGSGAELKRPTVKLCLLLTDIKLKNCYIMHSGEELKMLAELKKKRGIVKAALTRAHNFVSKFVIGEQSASVLEFRQEELPQLNKKFDDIQTQIELITFEDAEETRSERDNFENLNFSTRSQMQEIINADRVSNSTAHNVSNSAGFF